MLDPHLTAEKLERLEGENARLRRALKDIAGYTGYSVLEVVSIAERALEQDNA